MKNLLKLHFYNLLKQKSFYICTAFIIISGVSIVFLPMIIDHFMHHAIKPLKINDVLTSVTDASNYKLFLAILIPLFLTLDISNRTLKNIIGRGFSRKKVFISNFITSVIATTVIYLVMILIGLIITLLFGKMGSLSTKTLNSMLISYIIIIGMTAIYNLISTIVSKTSGSLIVCILVNMFASTIIMGVDTLLSFKAKISIGDYWIDSLKPSKPLISLLIGLVYIVGCFIIGLNVSNQKEIK